MAPSFLFLVICGTVICLAAIQLWRKISKAKRAAKARAEARRLGPKLAELLVRGLCIARVNPYYGGMGLRYADGMFVYAPVNDGYISAPSDEKMSNEAANRCELSSTDAFVCWLEAYFGSAVSQGVQPAITMERLQHAVAAAANHTNPDLSDYVY